MLEIDFFRCTMFHYLSSKLNFVTAEVDAKNVGRIVRAHSDVSDQVF